MVTMTQDKDDDSSLRFDDEMGVHHAGDGIENTEVERQYEFEVETEPVFKRLAEDIYQGREAGIREPLTNSVTSIIRATEEGYIDNPDEGIIVFELYEEGNIGRLTLRDNGVGITREELDKVVTQIGKSTSRSAEELTGKFGMGFLATWMLAGGTDGGFGMYSNPRGVDEGPFFGFWDNGGFSEMESPESSYAGLDEDENGVEFEIFLDQSISTEDVVSWIDKYSEWTRVPVLFRHHTEDGIEDEEYPPKRMIDKYESIQDGTDPEDLDYDVDGDELELYKVETDAFTAINTNLEQIDDDGSRVFSYSRSFNNCILMDVPIKPDWRVDDSFPLSSFELRLNYETPVVVDGPHKGCFVVTGDQEPESLGDDYIPYESLTTEDVVTPFPTGTRDYLQDDMGFIGWLSDKIYKMYYEDIAENVRSVSTLDEYCQLSDEEVGDFHEVMKEICDSYHLRSKSDVETVEDLALTSFNTEFKKALPVLDTRSVSLAPKGEKGVSRQQNRTNMKARKLVRNTFNDDDKRVFMAHRITQERAEFVWAGENQHYVVRVASGNQQKFKDLFGWEELGELDFEEDLEMSDEKRLEFTDNSQAVSEKRVTLHVGNYSTTKKMTAETLKENIENRATITDNNDNDHDMKQLILFHRTEDNISYHKDIVGESIASVSVGTDVYNYLKDSKNVWTADILEEGIAVTISDGTEVELPDENFPDNSVYHVVDEETAESFRQEEVMSDIQEWIQDNTDTPDDAVYVPITPVEKNFAGISIGYRTWSVDTQGTESRNHMRNIVLNSEVELYVRAILNEDSPAYEALKTVQAGWSEGGKELVQELTK